MLPKNYKGTTLKTEHDNVEFQAYIGLMNEVRIRLHSIRDVIEEKDRWNPRILREYCYLQLRILCEIIAISCLIAHGDHKHSASLKSWSVTKIMNNLERLNKNYFPRGVRIDALPNGGVDLVEYQEPQLSKEELIAFWQKSGNFLHRGSGKAILKESGQSYVVDLDEIMILGAKIKNLLEQHIISSANNRRHFIGVLAHDLAKGGAVVWQAESP